MSHKLSFDTTAVVSVSKTLPYVSLFLLAVFVEYNFKDNNSLEKLAKKIKRKCKAKC